MKEYSDPDCFSEMNGARLEPDICTDNENQKKSRMDKNT